MVAYDGAVRSNLPRSRDQRLSTALGFGPLLARPRRGLSIHPMLEVMDSQKAGARAGTPACDFKPAFYSLTGLV
jgi:hypothetical protein